MSLCRYDDSPWCASGECKDCDMGREDLKQVTVSFTPLEREAVRDALNVIGENLSSYGARREAQTGVSDEEFDAIWTALEKVRKASS